MSYTSNKLSLTFFLICVLCSLCCSYSQTWMSYLTKKRKKKDVYSACFDSILIIFNSSEFFTLFFLLNPITYNGQEYRTQKGRGMSDQSLFRLKNKFRKSLLHHFISDVVPDQVWWCNIKWLLSYSKNYILLIYASSWHHVLLHFHMSFWIWKVWKRREKFFKNLNISRMKRAFEMK